MRYAEGFLSSPCMLLLESTSRVTPIRPAAILERWMRALVPLLSTKAVAPTAVTFFLPPAKPRSEERVRYETQLLRFGLLTKSPATTSPYRKRKSRKWQEIAIAAGITCSICFTLPSFAGWSPYPFSGLHCPRAARTDRCRHLIIGVERNLRLWECTSESDSGCVKTPCCCYDSPVILRGELMRRFVEQADRGQWTLIPECLDDFIDESNPVRVIDVFVDALDLAEMSFEGVEPAATGRPSYHPSVLLKLYIYGYLNRVQSSRRLEREAGRNVEVMWLLGRLAPDHKTI